MRVNGDINDALTCLNENKVLQHVLWNERVWKFTKKQFKETSDRHDISFVIKVCITAPLVRVL